MPSSVQKENSARCMEHLCEHWFHGYTQGYPDRWGDGEGVCEVEGVDGSTLYVEQGDRDCSAGDVSAYEAAGISCGGATFTGDALSCMVASGNFRAHRMSDGWNCDDGYIAQRGDSYLAHHSGFEHMAMCTSSEPDMLAEFSGNEFGGILGGQVGDQTGWESHITGFYGGWDWCLECIVDDWGGGSYEPADDIRYMASIDPTGISWLPEMVGLYDRGGSSDDYAGIIGTPILWLACDARKYRVFTETSGWLPWVSSYDPGDLEFGCAGDGSPILGVEVEDTDVRYQVHVMHRHANSGVWYAEMVGNHDTGGSSDHFAGDLANMVDGVSMRRL